MVLGREDVAGGPANVGAERLQRLDQHRRLDRHVQRAGDARALQRLVLAEFLAAGHQARHFGLGDLDFLAAPVGERDVRDDVVLGFVLISVAPRDQLEGAGGAACHAFGVLTSRSAAAGQWHIKKSLFVHMCNEGCSRTYASSPKREAISAPSASITSRASPPAGGHADRAAGARRQHHQAHDRGAADRDAVLHDADLRRRSRSTSWTNLAEARACRPRWLTI